MSVTVIKNIGTIFTGDIESPVIDGPVGIVLDDGKIKVIAREFPVLPDKVIDANGMTVCPGFMTPIPTRSLEILPRGRISSILSIAASMAA